ncbi:glycosyltransferase [Paraurantiacibacter namhicola]|uniref:GDP-mannose-dependent alpha-(1-6)-phosphatidylinositol monomannoside mannosyltransferase n=1 Tax=Paraurantiacibacter namhicola TaxID=645517 RepID=A0A1C7D618_9SPHN|nr:glycosyltransferase [Paraurantiacibacter namhicola]ANU06909.1 GDP-mannose-dependent alpha-(1-6)-phosphatidylinositol monomannoside mannosyltransferase [Paraurantiacibacter namhicola]
MSRRPIRKIAILASQFAAYHVDRCAAVAQRLAPGVETVAVELAAGSDEYRWEKSGEVAGAQKRTLFSGRLEDIGWYWRFAALRDAVEDCDCVLMGISYDRPEAIALSWLLKSQGRPAILFTESKADDMPRSAVRELAKRAVLSAYAGAIVGARRQADYMRSLGFAGRPVTPGYDTVGTSRVRAAAGLGKEAQPVPAADAPFLFVGRYVDKKGLDTLLSAYAQYRVSAPAPRPLLLAGDGELRGVLERQASELGIAGHVSFTGFLSAPDVARQLASAFAFVLPSRVEQWGLVVNEALACDLPIIASHNVGSCDALVRQGKNGFTVPADDVQALADALAAMDRADWAAMSAVSRSRAPLGDVERLADAVFIMLGNAPREVRDRHRNFALRAGFNAEGADRALESLDIAG